MTDAYWTLHIGTDTGVTIMNIIGEDIASHILGIVDDRSIRWVKACRNESCDTWKIGEFNGHPVIYEEGS